MLVEEIKIRKEVMRKEIIESIHRFTEYTGIHPSEIDINIAWIDGRYRLAAVTIRVEV